MIVRFLFAFIILVHGLIHFMGFAKAFGYGTITQLTKEISKPAGFFWLLSAFLFIAATVLFLLKKESWLVVGIVAVVISQILIISVWKDARFGTIANIVVLIVALAVLSSMYFESGFQKDVREKLKLSGATQTELLKESDIQSLPQPVQNYLRYSGVINQPKVKNIRIVFEGEMRDKGKDWFKFNSLQYNFFDDPTRMFFMKAKMFGITVPGYHEYQDANAVMQVKLFGCFSVINAKGPEMNKAETVTVFNDMCLMAPATLIDKRIQWEPISNTSVKATFTNDGIKISAVLYFNDKGQLVNFISDDRYAISNMKQYRFSTPVSDYKLINGINVATYGETIWHYPEGEFVYGKFYMKNISYNVSEFKK